MWKLEWTVCFPLAELIHLHSYHDQMRRMVVEARDACASEQDSRGLQRRVSDSFLEWSGEDLQLPGDRRSIPRLFAPRVVAAGPSRRQVLSKQLASLSG